VLAQRNQEFREVQKHKVDQKKAEKEMKNKNDAG
jgi:hypothetical protein